MRLVDKTEALQLLADNRQRLLPDGEGCVMCALVGRAKDADERIVESEHGVVLLDRFGSRPGHMLIISREHVEDTTELPWPVYLDLQRLAYDGCHALQRCLQPVRVFNAILGASVQVPMSFPHFHIHLLPIHETDERARPAAVFSWTNGVVVYEDEEARTMAAQLRAAWSS